MVYKKKIIYVEVNLKHHFTSNRFYCETAVFSEVQDLLEFLKFDILWVKDLVLFLLEAFLIFKSYLIFKTVFFNNLVSNRSWTLENKRNIFQYKLNELSKPLISPIDQNTNNKKLPLHIPCHCWNELIKEFLNLELQQK